MSSVQKMLAQRLQSSQHLGLPALGRALGTEGAPALACARSSSSSSSSLQLRDGFRQLSLGKEKVMNSCLSEARDELRGVALVLGLGDVQAGRHGSCRCPGGKIDTMERCKPYQSTCAFVFPLYLDARGQRETRQVKLAEGGLGGGQHASGPPRVVVVPEGRDCRVCLSH